MDLLPATDEQLVLRVAAGEAPALEALYDRYVRQCFGLALRIVGDAALAEEVVQEVFLKLWTQPEKYASQKGKFVSWLLSLVHHRCIDELRRRSRTEVPLDSAGNGEGTTGSLLDSLQDPEMDPADRVSLKEQQTAVRAALQGIPEEQRQVLELAYYGGLSQSEIATRLQQPLGTVKTRMRTGLRRLRSLIAPDDG